MAKYDYDIKLKLQILLVRNAFFKNRGAYFDTFAVKGVFPKYWENMLVLAKSCAEWLAIPQQHSKLAENKLYLNSKSEKFYTSFS